MSKYIINKENEQIKPYNDITNKEREVVDDILASNPKEKTSVQSLYINEEKTKLSFSPLKIENNKKNLDIKSLGASEEKTRLSFSPLKIEEIKTDININNGGFFENKTRVVTTAEFTEKKQPSKLELSGITEKKSNEILSFPDKKEEKKEFGINQNYNIRQKENKNIKGELELTSKIKGEDLFKSQIIYSKNELPIESEITEKKIDEKIEYIPEFQQKKGPELYADSDISKEDTEINNSGELKDKESVGIDFAGKLNEKESAEIENTQGQPDKETVDIITELVLEDKKDFGIGDNLTLENKKEIELIGAKIEKLIDSEDPKRKFRAKEDVKGIFKLVSGFMNTVSLGLEGDLARVLTMPYETDTAISQGKSINNMLKMGSIAGTINGISGIGSMVSDAAKKLKYMSVGEIIAYYMADFYTLSASKPSPAVKSPGASPISLLSGSDFSGQILLGDGDGTGEINSSLIGNILGKISFLSNTANLKNFAMNQIKNFALGRIRSLSNLDNQKGNVQFNKKKEEYQVEINPRYYDDGPEKYYDYGKEGSYSLNRNPKNGPENKNGTVDIGLIAGDQYSVPSFEFESDRNKNKENKNKLNESFIDSYLSKSYRSNYDLGYMLVQPVAEAKDNLSVFKIEFQFNPEITESSQEAVYNSTTILNRIGNLYSYAGTNSMKPTLKLKYRVLSDNKYQGADWMGKWTLPYIQKIEMALRALTVPSVINNGTRSTTPPVVRINIGNDSNLFQFKIMKNTQQRHRYFVAASVEINKNYENKTYYIDEGVRGYYAADTMGFDATISLIEVKRSYFTMFPNLNDYYDSVTKDNNNLEYFTTQEVL